MSNIPLATHTHIQSVASDTWTITHGLQCDPIAQVLVNDGGVLKKMFPKEIEYPDASTVIITFSSPKTGECRLV